MCVCAQLPTRFQGVGFQRGRRPRGKSGQPERQTPVYEKASEVQGLPLLSLSPLHQPTAPRAARSPRRVLAAPLEPCPFGATACSVPFGLALHRLLCPWPLLPRAGLCAAAQMPMSSAGSEGSCGYAHRHTHICENPESLSQSRTHAHAEAQRTHTRAHAHSHTEAQTLTHAHTHTRKEADARTHTQPQRHTGTRTRGCRTARGARRSPARRRARAHRCRVPPPMAGGRHRPRTCGDTPALCAGCAAPTPTSRTKKGIVAASKAPYRS